INANMVFMAQIEKVLSDSEASSSSADETISENRIEKANQQNKDFENQNKYLQDKYDVLKNQATTFEMNNKELNEQLKELIEKNNDLIAQTKVLKDQLQVKNVVIDTHVECQEKYAKLEAENIVLEKDFKISELEECVRNKDLEIEKCLERLNVYENKLHKIEKIIIDLVDEVVSLLEKEKANSETIESLKSKGFESSETVSFESKNQSENDCHVVEKQCGNMESSKMIALGMFKLNVSQCVSPISMSKSSYLDTLCSDRRPKNSDVIWKKKGSSNTSNVGLSAVSVLNLNKNVKRYSCKDLLACNNSHLGEKISAYMCNDAMNVSCDSRMNDLLDDNNFF
nr:hypothetical protein [Tanacetum cinerariifolium]